MDRCTFYNLFILSHSATAIRNYDTIRSTPHIIRELPKPKAAQCGSTATELDSFQLIFEFSPASLLCSW